MDINMNEIVQTVEMFLSLAVVGAIIFGVIARACGWKKGVLIADELRDGFSTGRDHLLKAVDSMQPIDKQVAIHKAADFIASNTSGITKSDILPMVNALVDGARSGGTVEGKGLKLSLDPATGHVTVDPSGMISNKAHKISKFFKKVF